MEKKDFITLLQEARKVSKKRKFSQSIDLIVNLKSINLKKEDEKINIFMNLPHERGKKVRITALVGKELEAPAKKVCEHVLVEDKFKALTKKEIKKIAEQTDFFIAQSTIMPRIAQTFGKILGPRGLMPNPKSGCVVPPTADLTLVVKRIQTLVRLETRSELAVKTRIGTEEMKDEDLADNAYAVLTNLLQLLPQEKHNLRSVVIKTTMGKPSTKSFIAIKEKITEEEPTKKDTKNKKGKKAGKKSEPKKKVEKVEKKEEPKKETKEEKEKQE